MVWDLRLREAVLEVTLRSGTPILLTGLTDWGCAEEREGLGGITRRIEVLFSEKTGLGGKQKSVLLSGFSFVNYSNGY